MVIIAEPLGPICLPNNPVIQKPMKDKKTNGIYIFKKGYEPFVLYLIKN